MQGLRNCAETHAIVYPRSVQGLGNCMETHAIAYPRAENLSPATLLRCHAPIPGPTRLADPNRARGARPYTGTLYLIFFFNLTCTCGYGPHVIT